MASLPPASPFEPHDRRAMKRISHTWSAAVVLVLLLGLAAAITQLATGAANPRSGAPSLTRAPLAAAGSDAGRAPGGSYVLSPAQGRDSGSGAEERGMRGILKRDDGHLFFSFFFSLSLASPRAVANSRCPIIISPTAVRASGNSQGEGQRRHLLSVTAGEARKASTYHYERDRPPLWGNNADAARSLHPTIIGAWAVADFGGTGRSREVKQKARRRRDRWRSVHVCTAPERRPSSQCLQPLFGHASGVCFLLDKPSATLCAAVRLRLCRGRRKVETKWGGINNETAVPATASQSCPWL